MLEIKNLTYGYYSSYKVLENFSLNMTEGGIYGLLGKNGTGKSTLLYLIMGLLRPNSGEVLFNGINTKLRRPETLSEMFIVPEEYNLPNVTLKEYLAALSPFYPKFSNEILEKCLDGFDMTKDVHLGALSMGQKKKIYMCLALAANTSLLVMDEPTNGLDIPSKSQFRKVVASGITEDKTVIISTHQVRDVELLLDKLTIIDRNRILLNASMQDVADNLIFYETDRDGLSMDALYYEQSIRGYSVVAKKTAEADETPVNLELLFNALLCERDKIQAAVNIEKENV